MATKGILFKTDYDYVTIRNCCNLLQICKYNWLISKSETNYHLLYYQICHKNWYHDFQLLGLCYLHLLTMILTMLFLCNWYSCMGNWSSTKQPFSSCSGENTAHGGAVSAALPRSVRRISGSAISGASGDGPLRQWSSRVKNWFDGFLMVKYLRHIEQSI